MNAVKSWIEDLGSPLFQHGLAIVVIVLLAFALHKILQRALEVSVARTHLPRIAATPLAYFARYGVTAAGCLVILGRFYDLSGLWVAFTTVLAMVAVGFVAVWSVLSNALCTVFLIVSRPFSIGDDVEIPQDGVAGRVVDLTLLFTTLKTPGGELYRVPNNLFFQKVIKCRQGETKIALEEQLARSTPAE